MADDDSPKAADQEEQAAGGGLGKKLFNRKGNPSDQGQGSKPPEQGVAHIPATVLTVEYVDDSEGMDAALKSMNERLRKLEQQMGALQETQTQMVAVINRQGKDLATTIESIGRRIDRLYTRMREPASRDIEDLPAVPEEPGQAATDVEAMADVGLSADVADDPDHQNAWRIARVLAADLQAYHESAVKEGVIYGTFYQVLKEPIGKARRTYEQRVSKEIVDNYDYFSKALDELIARKKMELEEEGV